MSDAVNLVSAALAGVALGAMFFGGLLWSVRKSLTTRNPAAWLFASLMLRMGLVLVGFYVVARGNGSRWAACVVGFVLARLVVTHFATHDRTTRRTTEAAHAPES